MQRIQWMCDRCGGEIPNADDVMMICGYDLCSDCYEAVRAAVTELVVKSKPTRFDWGKAQALRDAGWTLEQIAKELGSTVASVSRNTKASKPRKRYEHETAEAEPAILKSPNLI